LLDKHKLALQLSQRRPSSEAAAAATALKAPPEGAGTKLVVRNVAFEATRRDLQSLFGPFGHMKSCRLPKKLDGSHRGFAFVEFTTKQEAKAAMAGVGGVHLYGRRLVVEYAAGDEGLDELRAKTAAKLRKTVVEGDEAGVYEAAPAAKRLKTKL